jgi:adenylate cyclase
MAFFGAPIFFGDHAKHACRCALQSIKKLRELQQEFKARGLPEIDIGIGINTGEMSVGNMGSDIVRNFTVMGDAVNLGSRLEGINKEYGTRIIISEFTQKEVATSFTTREVDWVRVKGKNLPVRIFELVSEGPPDQDTKPLLEHFDRGFRLYHEKQFDQALEAFNQALAARPDDPVSALYVERCQEYAVEPPPAEWDGVYTMKTK